ncbi:protein trichome birefringence-like 26 [Cucumis melo var. makuwa]|uniref:Protein trichome birefringence-like 26 n=2 Tax=Cucumis melo var. makuwa TaxID=1194695 RepID=A0A5D3C1U3_CUCMM|nr:protein trichome birefringence-like 26 [Cucumis melo var. makuwa]
MKIESHSPFFLRKHMSCVLLKFALFLLFAALSFHIFLSLSFKLVSFPHPPLDSTDLAQTQPQNDSRTECDIFVGEWVEDSIGPFYTNESCHFIESHQNCMRNGRPDTGYLHWRWNPAECELPRFNPGKFLRLMRNKSWAFVGDSIQRNHVQSLLCILSQYGSAFGDQSPNDNIPQVEEAIETYHDEEYRSKKWHFPSHNFTLSVIWSPFLTKAAIFEDINGVSSSEIKLHLDELDEKWTSPYKDLDYVVFAGGKWFLKAAIYYENNTVTGCHNCLEKNMTDLGFAYAYRKAIGLVFDFITRSDHKAFVLFRTTIPDHFENGEWFSGGQCNRTVPFKGGEVEMKDVDVVMRNIELQEFDKVVKSGIGKAPTLKLLDTTRLSLLRPDGHPSWYRQFHPFAHGNGKVQIDCLHWCLPGPIDSWNDLLFQLLIHGVRA